MAETKLELTLHNIQQARIAVKEQLLPFLGQWLTAGKKLYLVVSLQLRTKPQNKRYWGKGVLAQIANQAVVGGRMYDAEAWHELFKRKFIGVIELPNGQVVGMSSTKLSTAEFCEFCAKVEAYAVTDLGVVFEDLYVERYERLAA